MAQEWWANDPIAPATQQPRVQRPLPSPPKQVDPYTREKDAFSQDMQVRSDSRGERADARASADQARQEREFPYKRGDALRQDFNALPAIKEYRAALPALMTGLKTAPDATGDNALIYAYAKAMDPGSVVRESEMGMAASGGSWVESTVANLKKQLGVEGGGQLSPDVRARLRREMNSKVAQLAKAAGVSRADFQALAQRQGVAPEDVVGGFPAAPYMQEYERIRPGAQQQRPSNDVLVSAGTANAINDQQGGAPRYTPQQERALIAYGPSAESPEDLLRFAQAIGAPITPESAQQAFDYYKQGGKEAGSVNYAPSDAAYQAQINAEIARRGGNQTGGGDLLAQGGTFGLSDEIVGGVSAVARGLAGDGQGYQFERDLYRKQLGQTRDDLGSLGTALEIGGALMTGNPQGAFRVAPTLAGRVQQGARAGAAGGALAGFGYGEGTQNSLLGAAIGGAGGAVIGGALPLGGEGLNALARRLPRRAPIIADPNPADVAAAGQAEGVTVRRAMVDPSSANTVIGVERSMAGGPIVQRAMNETAGQIESGVQRLGQGGTAMEPSVAGQTLIRSGKRLIEKSGKIVGRVFDSAEKAAGGVKLPAPSAVKTVDDAIARLSETPGTNAKELAYLETLKSDLSKPITVGALRDLRTTLRKQISKGELVFGQNEARVLGVMDALSSDITAGLTAAGKSDAARLFSQADDMYRQRMDFIQNTIQKIVGKRDANLPPEQVFSRFKAMASPKGDEAGLARMMRTMEPDEAADIAATFAEQLGKNTNGEFSPAMLIKQAENLPKAARINIFGPEGAQSIENLVTLSRAYKNVPMGGSPTGVANDYRDWLTQRLLGAAVGGAAGYTTGGGDVATGLAGAAIGGGVKTARDILTARAVMSPKIIKWIRSAPKTTNPRAIDAHFKRLSAIASQEPALAGDIQIISQRIMDAAKSGFGSPSAGQDIPDSSGSPE